MEDTVYHPVNFQGRYSFKRDSFTNKVVSYTTIVVCRTIFQNVSTFNFVISQNNNDILFCHCPRSDFKFPWKYGHVSRPHIKYVGMRTALILFQISNPDRGQLTNLHYVHQQILKGKVPPQILDQMNIFLVISSL